MFKMTLRTSSTKPVGTICIICSTDALNLFVRLFLFYYFYQKFFAAKKLRYFL